MRISGADEARAQAVLAQCGHHVKLAVLALNKQLSVGEARAALDAADGNLRQALLSP